MGAALTSVCRSNQLSGVHVNFCRREEAEQLTRLGYLTRVGVQYHWENRGYADFEDFLAEFRSKRRNQVRRERREVAASGVEIEVVTGDAIEPSMLDPMVRFYQSTVRQRMWGREYLNRAFFELLWQRFRHRLVLIVARQRGRLIGGTLNVQKGDALYGRYWGADREIRHLHFEVCYYAAVEHCIAHRLKRFEPGAGGDYKQVRGFDGRPTWSAHFLADERLRGAVARFLATERKEMEAGLAWLQEHSALKPA
jgi:predicted N-acyltransferase